jgi:hypothetical protein
MDLFETASRKKYRFPSEIGDLTAEQLWDLPLLRSQEARPYPTDLNTVATRINEELKGVTVDSFVQVDPVPGRKDIENRLELVKHVIKVKVDAAEAAKRRAERDAQRRRLLDALADAEARELGSMSRDEIMAKLAEIDEAA